MTEKNVRKTIFDGNDISAIYDHTQSDTIIISFSPCEHSENTRAFYTDGFLQRNKLSAILILSKKNNWYQTPELDTLIEIVRNISAPYTERITYGHSMGAYGALITAGSLSARAVVTAPQTTISTPSIGMPSAWIDEIKRYGIIRDDIKEQIASSKGVDIIYDPMNSIDRQHFKYIKELKNVRPYILPFGGHSIPKCLREMGIFSETILGMLTKKLPPHDFRKSVRPKKTLSSTYIAAIIQAATKRKSSWVARLLLRALKNSKGKILPNENAISIEITKLKEIISNKWKKLEDRPAFQESSKTHAIQDERACLTAVCDEQDRLAKEHQAQLASLNQKKSNPIAAYEALSKEKTTLTDVRDKLVGEWDQEAKLAARDARAQEKARLIAARNEQIGLERNMQTLLVQANKALRQGKYADAIELYNLAIREHPALAKIIKFNLELARNRHVKKSASPLEKTSDDTIKIKFEATNSIQEAAVETTKSDHSQVQENPSHPAHPDAELLRDSVFFDEAFYSRQAAINGDKDIDLATHYLAIGSRQGLDPSPKFSTKFYLYMHDDVAAAGINPLTHYLLFGKYEGREISQAGWVEPDHSTQQKRQPPLESWIDANRLTPKRISQLQNLLHQNGYKTTKSPKFDLEVYEFSKRIQSKEIITFDIFDTLLIRSVVKPTDIFTIIEKEVKNIGIYSGPFCQERILAENEARRNSSHEEITLEEIYNTLQTKLKLTNRITETIKSIELETEIKNIQPRPLGMKLYEIALNSMKKVHLISDFYMPASSIRKILTKIGVLEFESLWVSCDHRATKHTGRLFDLFISQLKTQPSSIIHVGDNQHSDGEMARSRGITPYVLAKELDMAHQNPLLLRSWGNDFANRTLKPAESVLISISMPIK